MNTFVITIAATVGLSFGYVIGAALCGAEWREAAIKNNAAEWRVDRTTGLTSFVWLTAPAKP